MLINFPFLSRLFEEQRAIAIPPRHERERERQRENVKVFGASYLEACHSFNMCTRMLTFGMEVPFGYTIDVLKLKLKNNFKCLKFLTCFELNFFVAHQR